MSDILTNRDTDLAPLLAAGWAMVEGAIQFIRHMFFGTLSKPSDL